MGKITEISVQKKDKSRCNIYVDGKFVCGLKTETVMLNRIKVGGEIETEELSALQFESEKATAFDKALTHISVTQKTEKEIRDFLTKKGYLPEVISYVVDKMKEYKFINDETYAETYAEYAVKKKGKKLIKMELKNKGVSDKDIQNAVENLQGENETAKKIAEKYMRGKTVDKVNLQKTFRYLLSKGFDYEIARDALKSLGDVDEYEDGGI